MRNSECGIRNYFCSAYLLQTPEFRRGGLYIRPLHPYILLVFSITINERPYFHRIKPLKIGTFLLKNCMPKIAVAIRDGKPVPYRKLPKMLVLNRADIESAPTVFVTN